MEISLINISYKRVISTLLSRSRLSLLFLKTHQFRIINIQKGILGGIFCSLSYIWTINNHISTNLFLLRNTEFLVSHLAFMSAWKIPVSSSLSKRNNDKLACRVTQTGRLVTVSSSQAMWSEQLNLLGVSVSKKSLNYTFVPSFLLPRIFLLFFHANQYFEKFYRQKHCIYLELFIHFFKVH